MSAFFAGGALLAADAWQRAWRPSLWTTFEALARVQRLDADSAGRRLPLDDEAFAVVRGRLRADAAMTASGVSLSVDVEGLEGRDGQDGQEGREGQEGGDRDSTIVWSAKALAASRLAGSSSPSPDRWPPIAWTNGAPAAWSACRCNCDARRDT